MKKLKDIRDSIIFILLFFGFPIIAGMIVEYICNIITMKMIMTTISIIGLILFSYIIYEEFIK